MPTDPWFQSTAAPSKSLQSCPTRCDHTESSPPGSPIPGFLRTRILEWVATSFSNACIHAKSLQSCPTPCEPMESSALGPLSTGFSRQEYWSRLPFPSPVSNHTCYKQGACPLDTRLSIPRPPSRGRTLELLSFQPGSPFLPLLRLLTRFRTSALLSLRLHRRAYIPSLLNLGSWEYGLPLLSLSPNMPVVSTHTCLVYYTLDSASLPYWNCLVEQEFITCWTFTLKHKCHNNYLVAL